MIITEIEALNRSKAQIVIDDDIRFVLPAQAVGSLGLFAGQELSDREYSYIYEEYIKRPAKLKALNLLERRDYTKKELCDKLKQQGFPESAVSEALSYVESYHYVDDIRYTQSYLSYRCAGKSRQMIYQTLLSKGVDAQTVRSCMEELEIDDIKNIERLCLQKFGDIQGISPEKKQKIFNYFLRKGYKYGDIASVIKEFDSI